jgi:hypothetical protein
MNGMIMSPRFVSTAFALVLASAATTALAHRYDAPAAPVVTAKADGRLAVRFPAPPAYGPDALAALRDIRTTGSLNAAR